MRFLIVILSLAFVFFIGMIVADEIIPSQKPVAVHVAISPRIREVVKVETKMVPYEVVKVVPYETVVEVEKLVEVVVVRVEHMIPIDWDSLEELDRFYKGTEAATQLLAGKDGEIQFNGQCIAYAIGYRDAAATEIGKDLSIYRITPREYNKLFSEKRIKYTHAVNMALVGYELWLIEPETGERVLYGYVP